MPLHNKLTAGELHQIHNWEYADSTAREAVEGLTADDLYKIALEQDSSSLWILIGYDPPDWEEISVGTHASRTDNPHQVDADDVGRNQELWNAYRIRSVTVKDEFGQNDKALIYNSTSGMLEYGGHNDLYGHGSNGIAVPVYPPSLEQFYPDNPTPWVARSYLIWPGSNTVGTPVNAKFLVKVGSGQTGEIRIVDIPNGLTVATTTNITNTSFQIFTNSSLGNISLGETYWEIQIRRTAGSGALPDLRYVYINF